MDVQDLSAVVNLMGDLGRSEGSTIASILSRRVCLEKGGNALSWLNTVVSLSFYSSIDDRSIESVLNHAFIQEVLANSWVTKWLRGDKLITYRSGKMALVLRMLMQVDYYASTLDYSGPRLSSSLLTEDDVRSLREWKIHYQNKSTFLPLHTSLSHCSIFSVCIYDADCVRNEQIRITLKFQLSEN